MLPAATFAQTLTTFADLPSRLNVGDTVTVEQAEGPKLRGRIVRIRPDELVVNTKGTDVSLPGSRVQRVSMCCDGLMNGTLIGLGISGFLGLFATNFSDDSTSGDVIVNAIIFGGIGAGLGAGLDALIRTEKTVYRARPVSARVSLAPGRQQAGVTWSW